MRIWKFVLIIGISGITIYAIFQGLMLLYVLLPWSVPWVGNIIIANPPKPEITYGEFPFNITYELNGEIKKIEDVVVCEFDGFELRGTAGKYRKWKAYLKSGNEYITLLRGNNKGIIFEIRAFYGLPNYYMGDLEYEGQELYEKMLLNKELAYCQWENGVQSSDVLSEDEAFDKYRIRIIDTQFSPPIKNEFK